MTTTALDRLSWTIHDHGIDADAAGVRAFARAAGSRGMSPVLLGILMDDRAPAPVRERAFGRLASRFAR